MQQHRGQLIIGDTNIEAVEVDWNPSRIVVVAFPSMDAAKAWYNSSANHEILPIRNAYTNDKIILVEGL